MRKFVQPWMRAIGYEKIIRSILTWKWEATTPRPALEQSWMLW